MVFGEFVLIQIDSLRMGVLYAVQIMYTQLLTVDKLLLLLRSDADQMGFILLTVLLSLRPGISLRNVEITVAHELQPAFGTAQPS